MLIKYRNYFREFDLNTFDSFPTAVWTVIITMTTVGYGDIYAVSPLGRMVSIFNALWGTFLVSLLIVMIAQLFDLHDREKKSISEISNSESA